MFKVLDERRKSSAVEIGKPARRVFAILGTLGMATGLAACQTVGPSRGEVDKAVEVQAIPGLQVIDVNDTVARQIAEPAEPANVFATDLGGAEPVGTTVGVGDVVEVTIWEASPPALFGSVDLGVAGLSGGSHPNTLPPFVIDESGTIAVPFAGKIRVVGKTPNQIEQDIVSRLQGKAHLPQAVVSISRNVTATATVLGDVKDPKPVPLTPHGERILDALSAAGGTEAPLDRVTIQITRGNVVRRMPARLIVSHPSNNVVLKSGDIIDALYQPNSFTVLGAAGKNDEVRFEGVGLTLSQALGRVAGLNGELADPKGVFIFRWEKPSLLSGVVPTGAVAQDRAVPVIYRVDLKDPKTYLAAQRFQMRDGDVLYVAHSRTSDFRRFLSVVASSLVPLNVARSVTR